MSAGTSLRRQIVLSLTIMVLGVILLSIVGTYVFYALASAYSPGSISQTWVPSRVELAWTLGTTLTALCIAGYVAFKLSSRILTPLNSVAQNLREVAQGNLQARASAGEHAQGETAQLVHDFNTLAERLESVTREQQFWNAAVAHELRTPLTILRGRLQGLAEGVFAPAPEMFEGLLRQVEGLGRLVEDLRVLSLKDSQHLVLDLAVTDLAQDVSATVQTLAGSLQARGFHVHLDLEQASVVCDGFRIRQALTALLENALTHADPGQLTIRTRIEDGFYTLSVEDQGPGVCAEIAPQVFEAFRRGDPSRSRASGGSGLGLAVVKAIAQAHDGHALCQPCGAGTRFVIQLPLRSDTTVE